MLFVRKKRKKLFFIVDHNIRKNSTSEANFVKKKLHSLKIKSEILTIQKIKKYQIFNLLPEKIDTI